MRNLISILLALSLSGCASMGMVFKGMGNGLTQNSARPLPRTYNTTCTETYWDSYSHQYQCVTR